jgi:hypothetical protein
MELKKGYTMRQLNDFQTEAARTGLNIRRTRTGWETYLPSETDNPSLPLKQSIHIEPSTSVEHAPHCPPYTVDPQPRKKLLRRLLDAFRKPR